MTEQKFASVADYIASYPADVQPVLERIRAAILAAIPDAGETISYHIPTFTLDGHALLYFAGWKRHVSIYPVPAGDAEFGRLTEPYLAAKSTLKFPLSKPIPYDLIERVARVAAAQRRSG